MDERQYRANVRLKPNCGLENTRASLILRRIEPLCSHLASFPERVRENPGTIPFLRDHGLFVFFSSPSPEQVIRSMQSSFFVESCDLVDDDERIPEPDASKMPTEDAASAPGVGLVDRDDEADAQLNTLLPRIESAQRAIKAHVRERLTNDRTVDSLLFEQERLIDQLRTVVLRSRLKPFSSIVPNLTALVDTHAANFSKDVELRVEGAPVTLDRTVLAAIEETLKRCLRATVRGDIELPDERLRAGKPPKALISISVENAGSSIFCRYEHDGLPFDARALAQAAEDQGLLARPADQYTDEELGELVLLPRFTALSPTAHLYGPAYELNEIGASLQRAGAHGSVRNTKRGTVEIMFEYPVPFTVFDVVLFTRGGAKLALPVHQIDRFEAYHAESLQEDGTYRGLGGIRHRLVDRRVAPALPACDSPAAVVLLSPFGHRRAMTVDHVDGYTTAAVYRLPALLDRAEARNSGCIGYTVAEDGSPYAVLGGRHLAVENRTTRKTGLPRAARTRAADSNIQNGGSRAYRAE